MNHELIAETQTGLHQEIPAIMPAFLRQDASGRQVAAKTSLSHLLARRPLDLRLIADAVRMRATLSAEILQACNSSLRAFEPVATVEEAIVLLGADRVQAIVTFNLQD